jgi:uncharacterized damage-inducible protein DinB
MKSLITLFAVLFSTSAFCQGQMQMETAGSLAFTSGKVMQLAEAVPAEKYGWTPQDGVRSFAQVFAHIIGANYFFASKLGAQIPADVNMETIEMSLKNKEEIQAALKQSYGLIINAIKNTKDEALANKVEFPFPGEYTSMSAILIGLTHTNEHLGQLIAYSRMNGITPPWSK